MIVQCQNKHQFSNKMKMINYQKVKTKIMIKVIKSKKKRIQVNEFND